MATNDERQTTNDSPDSTENLHEEILNLTEQLKRSQADFINFKRRLEKDQETFVQFTYAQVLSKMLPALDNFTRAMQHVPAEMKDSEWMKGMVQTVKQFESALKSFGVDEISTIGERANPELHDIVQAGPGEKDVILEEFEKGYTLQGKVLRPAKVKVGDGS